MSRNGADLEPARDTTSTRCAPTSSMTATLLLDFADEVDTVTRGKDPKLAALVEELAAIAAEAEEEGIGETDTRDKRKVLVFTYFADTVDWIVEYLERARRQRPRLGAYRGGLPQQPVGATGRKPRSSASRRARPTPRRAGR